MLGSRRPRVTLTSPKLKQPMAAFDINSPSAALGFAENSVYHVLSSGIFACIVCGRCCGKFYSSAFISFYAIGYKLCFASIGTVCSEVSD